MSDLIPNDFIADLEAMSNFNTEVLDLTPFDEPIDFKIERFGRGYRAICKIRINYRWATECEYIESARIFGHKGLKDEAEFKKECITAIADIQDKRLWIFKANHGLLDREGAVSGRIRFKA